MRKTIFYVGTFVLCLLLLSGCGKLERKGTPAENAPPQVYFSNIPADSTYFSANPRIYWFGTDVDGFVSAYQYAIIVADSVISYGGLEQVRSFLYDIPSDSTSWVEHTALNDILGYHVKASYGGQQQYVRMFADIDPSIYTPQYVFLRAVDNSGKVSDVIYRIYWRNNHRPEAFFEVDSQFALEAHYCLEETTLTWDGISISWSGLDTADYPDKRNQPKFKFKWVLLGPFPSEPDSNVDVSKVFYHSLDSIYVAGQWKESDWVSENSHIFKGLENSPYPRQQNELDSGFGWYQLRLWAQDDAFVSNEFPNTMNFRIIKPSFKYSDQSRKTILLVDATAYGGLFGGLPLDTTLGLVKPFFRDALDSLDQDLCDEWVVWYDPLNTPDMTDKDAPDKDMLSKYDLIIVVDVGSKPGISTDNLEAYQEYLDIGGSIWFIGMNNYNVDTGEDVLKVPDFWVDYLGIESALAPVWTILDSTTLEFIQAKSFGLWKDLPSLEVNAELCHNLIGYSDTASVSSFGERGIPYVSYEVLSSYDYKNRIPYERRMMSFVSFYGSLSSLHGKPCGTNFLGPTFRTAEITIPLNLMKNEPPDYPAFKLFEEVVRWFFLEDLP